MEDIQFRYQKSTRYTDGREEVYANKANIGTLSQNKVAPECLYWSPDISENMVYNVSFQFRNEETFMTVVEELKRYKTEQGYKYLVVYTFNGYLDKLDKKLFEKAGFRTLPKENPEFMFLE